MEFNELQLYVDELYTEDCRVFKGIVTPKEERYMKNLYTGFLIGHWSALLPERKKGFVEERVMGNSGGRISWWLHIAKGLIELESIKGISINLPDLPEKKVDLTKVDFLEINRVCANPS